MALIAQTLAVFAGNGSPHAAPARPMSVPQPCEDFPLSYWARVDVGPPPLAEHGPDARHRYEQAVVRRTAFLQQRGAQP